MSTSKLAILGGIPVRDTKLNPWPKWPVWDQHEADALLQVLHSGIWSYNGPFETEFNHRFSEYIGCKHTISCVNGTVTLQLILEALGIGWGDEVIVPGLTWQATAAAVIDVNATPVLVDVLESNWCIDPQQIEAAITPRTRAIIPVHLYGSFANMDRILELARKHQLFVIEDCAHKHGGEWNGQKAGSIGIAGSFSFQLSKILTSGEGGAITTNDHQLAEKLDALRNCGRRPEHSLNDQADKGAGQYEDEGNFIQSGNYRITEFQAAILLEGLQRLPSQNEKRDKNGIYLNKLLSELNGIQPMYRDPKETKESYFNFAFRYEQEHFRDLPVSIFRKALEAELGVQVDSCYTPLNQCDLYQPHTKPSRHHLNDQYWEKINPENYSLPICEKIFHQNAICFHHKILMGDQSEMDLIATAIGKIYEQADVLSECEIE
ncbi:MAG: DegT/DnrJ/EryC1/StrS family aminotransferase [Saprospiraceae bacterium]|nr:DegT/DnrJ/EryC1/StrS family aminotransferase [Saprospiraceae bacterium]